MPSEDDTERKLRIALGVVSDGITSSLDLLMVARHMLDDNNSRNLPQDLDRALRADSADPVHSSGSHLGSHVEENLHGSDLTCTGVASFLP